jgi:hypothetical protein
MDRPIYAPGKTLALIGVFLLGGWIIWLVAKWIMGAGVRAYRRE